MVRRRTSTYGFTRTSALLQGRIRAASESRGFAQSRLLTQWPEIAGPDIAAISRPVEIGYGRGGMGATLTLLTTGAHAPVLEMQKDTLRDRVNAVYGYNAIARIRITQTAATGFAEGQASFVHRAEPAPEVAPDPALTARARDEAGGVTDEGLRGALERLALNVLGRRPETGR
ncbi:DUF721 domain-containing protein [Roseivivax isoporae]|uniref:RNA-binding protein n=1 Tax=Roseivivax isoporae LMG 25204 TaxID=1449351 RepID=X7F5E5_9RHOB|nr:DciA family protein [Roseivivax isoporae]ETX27953.1 hypothetical protein RISW2_10075 [Roseivivax isoporae LMG 25204]